MFKLEFIYTNVIMVLNKHLRGYKMNRIKKLKLDSLRDELITVSIVLLIALSGAIVGTLLSSIIKGS